MDLTKWRGQGDALGQGEEDTGEWEEVGSPLAMKSTGDARRKVELRREIFRWWSARWPVAERGGGGERRRFPGRPKCSRRESSRVADLLSCGSGEEGGGAAGLYTPPL
jgi:hypothetical protein